MPGDQPKVNTPAEAYLAAMRMGLVVVCAHCQVPSALPAKVDKEKQTVTPGRGQAANAFNVAVTRLTQGFQVVTWNSREWQCPACGAFNFRHALAQRGRTRDPERPR